MYSNAWEGSPPLHPKLLNAVAQSTSCCSDREMLFPVACVYAASSEPVVLPNCGLVLLDHTIFVSNLINLSCCVGTTKALKIICCKYLHFVAPCPQIHQENDEAILGCKYCTCRHFICIYISGLQFTFKIIGLILLLWSTS